MFGVAAVLHLYVVVGLFFRYFLELAAELFHLVVDFFEVAILEIRKYPVSPVK